MIVIPFILRKASDGKYYGKGSLVIINDGTGTRTRGNYDYQFLDVHEKPYKTGRVEGYHRNALSKWSLVAAVLKDAGYV